MSAQPTEISLSLVPSSRFATIDVARYVENEYEGFCEAYPRGLYCSLHTTAGFLDRSLSSRLDHSAERVDQFIGAFQTLFPPEQDYRHDQLHLRHELSEEQKRVEPRNADSHLTFMGAGMRNCVTYLNRPGQPVYFIDLDGVNGKVQRERRTRVLGYQEEEVVDRRTLEVPVSRHPIDSINLADPRDGFLERIDEVIAREGIQKGRIDLALDPAESRAALTVNEYETLLMRHDLPHVLRNPLRHAAIKGRNMIRDPLAIPGKTMNYAKYDFVQVFNQLLEALHISDSVLERLLARFLALPAERFLRMKRSVSFLVSDGDTGRPGRLVRGRYQSPILVQWGAAEAQRRRVTLSLVRFK
ncbi:MAG: hypothetical protein R6W82_02845 [bacterium]